MISDANLGTQGQGASNMLLLSSLPTELAQIGFEDSVHLVAFHREGECTCLAKISLGRIGAVPNGRGRALNDSE